MKGLSRARIGALSAAVGVLLVGLSVTGPSASAATNSLSSWTKQGTAGAGTWTVAGDGNSVTGTSNGAPTFFVSPFLKESATFEVDITPSDSAENDWVGLVLGYTSPTTAGENTTCASSDCPNNYLLVDWKQTTEASGQAGFTLMRVNGNFNIRDNTESLPCFGTHAGTGCTILDDGRADNFGWNEGAKNTLRVTYGPGSVKIENVGTLATTTVLEATGTFPTGRIGLYNYSQAATDFVVRDLADPNAPTTTTTSTSTTSTTVAPTSTTQGSVTTLATRIVRTGPNDNAGLELALGAVLIVVGALMTAARGKRPEGAYFK
jgi:hypothetical protein